MFLIIVLFNVAFWHEREDRKILAERDTLSDFGSPELVKSFF